MTNTDRTLTIGQALDLSRIIEAAYDGRTVARVIGEEVFEGQARCFASDPDRIGTDLGADVRDLLLRVTDRIGVEYYWPVTELLEEISGDDRRFYIAVN